MATSPICNDTSLTAEMSEELEESKQEEINLLEAIYITELTLAKDESGHVNTVTLLLHPATGENAQLQYVCLTLEFFLPAEYPSVCPEMAIRNPRGLSDEHLTELRDGLHQLAEDRRGNPMLYELIEFVKESLTQSNVPHGSCIICLEPFDEGQAFTKTACYHYFHSTCLVRYIEHSISEMEDRKKEAQQHQHLDQKEAKDVVCPICRVKIRYDSNLMANSPIPESMDDIPPLSKEIRRKQAEMASLFERQKAKGGIIDLEEEKNRYLVTRDTVLIIPAEPSPSSSCQSEPSPEEPVDDVPGKKNNRRRQKKSGKPPQDETKSRSQENTEENGGAMTKEEADLNKRRLMNQRRRNNQQQFRNHQRQVKEETSENGAVSACEETARSKMEQLHLEKNGDESHISNVVKDSTDSESVEIKVSSQPKREKSDAPKKNWDRYHDDKGRFSGHRGRGRGRGSDKSWGNRDGARNDTRSDYYSQKDEDGSQSSRASQSKDWQAGGSQDYEDKKPRSQGRGRGRGSNSYEKQQRAPGGSSSRHYQQRDYRQHGGYDQQPRSAPRHQKNQWEDNDVESGYWDEGDQYAEGRQGTYGSSRDRGRPRKSQDYYGQRNYQPQRGRGYRGNYYQDKYDSTYDSTADYQSPNGYDKHSDSHSERTYSKDKVNEHYRGRRQSGGFGRYSQNVAFPSDSSR